MNALTARIVVEDSKSEHGKGILARHGLSILLEVTRPSGKTSILMDAGPSAETVAHNVQTMGLDVRGLDAVVLSHGHYDHCGGLLQVLEMVGRPIPVIAHPRFFRPKVVFRPNIKAIGSPFSASEVQAAGGVLLLASNAVQIAQGVTTTGEVRREVEFEKTEGFWTIENDLFVPDLMPDDQAVVLSLGDKGLVVVTGCAHSGIVNTLRCAQRVAPGSPIHAVIGGLHLSRAGRKRISRTVEELGKMDLELVAPCHCTGNKATAQLVATFGSRCRVVHGGDVIVL